MTNYNKLPATKALDEKKRGISVNLCACQAYIYTQLTIFYVDSGYEIYRAVRKSSATF